MTNVDAAIKAAVSSVFSEYAPNVYQGDALEYAVWNYYMTPQVFAERLPAAARYAVQVHYYLPPGKNPNPVKLSLMSALSSNGFSWPSITNASDSDGQHYVFECEYINAGGVYGQT